MANTWSNGNKKSSLFELIWYAISANKFCGKSQSEERIEWFSLIISKWYYTGIYIMVQGYIEGNKSPGIIRKNLLTIRNNFLDRLLNRIL